MDAGGDTNHHTRIDDESQGLAQTETQQTDISLDDQNIQHLQKITDFKSYAKGLMDIALVSANANQLRTVIEYKPDYSIALITMLTLSILLQVAATLLLLVERLSCKKNNFRRCHQYNLSIAIIVCLIIFINIFITAWGVPSGPHVPQNVSGLE